MAIPVPQYSRSEVNRAGDILLYNNQYGGVSFPTMDFWEELDWAIEVLNNWRSCHAYPINTFQATLRNKIRYIGLKKVIVAQRLKRQASILSKLGRFEKMRLSRMQDIGGLRAVVNTLRQVRLLEKNYLESNFEHQLVNVKDYIESPKESGYRSVHLIYKYKNKRRPDYDGLQIELQIRNQLQHAWATAVETMGTFLQQALKSSEGSDEWLEFFALTGSAFARYEKCAPVPGYGKISERETYRRTKREAKRLDVRRRLRAFSFAVDKISTNKQPGSYHLIILDFDKRTVTIKNFPKRQLELASREYSAIERRISDGESVQAVLVSAGPIGELRKAYPNYFLDTTEFIKTLDKISLLA